MQITLNSTQRDVLISLLDAAVSDVRAEIYHTEDYQFKESLRTKKTAMEEILGQMIGPSERPEYPVEL